MSATATCATASTQPSVAPAHTASTLRSVTRTRRAPTDASNPDPVTPMNPLARLILRRKDELEMTWQELADKGGFSSHTILYALAHKAEHRQVPRPETLKRLAKAIDVPLDIVKATAAEAAGYTVQDITVPLESAQRIRVVVQAMGKISQADQDKLVKLAEAFANEVEDKRQQG